MNRLFTEIDYFRIFQLIKQQVNSNCHASICQTKSSLLNASAINDLSTEDGKASNILLAHQLLGDFEYYDVDVPPDSVRTTVTDTKIP